MWKRVAGANIAESDFGMCFGCVVTWEAGCMGANVTGWARIEDFRRHRTQAISNSQRISV
jgi:hypothetical protein